MPEPIVLASASLTRARLLEGAGVPVTIEPARIDESAIKQEMRHAGKSAIECAQALAQAKAAAVSARRPDALVIGADQLLVAGEEWFDKPETIDDARVQLLSLRGCTHILPTAACVVRAGKRLWQTASVPALTMRPFSEAFLDSYIAEEAEALLGSVGAYRLEGRGAQLFSRMTGDHFAVLGLPLFELLDFLRGRGALLS